MQEVLDMLATTNLTLARGCRVFNSKTSAIVSFL
jgi:hypothetical protein